MIRVGELLHLLAVEVFVVALEQGALAQRVTGTVGPDAVLDEVVDSRHTGQRRRLEVLHVLGSPEQAICIQHAVRLTLSNHLGVGAEELVEEPEASAGGESCEQVRVDRLADQEVGAHDRGGKVGSLVRVRVSRSGGEVWWALRWLTHRRFQPQPG